MTPREKRDALIASLKASADPGRRLAGRQIAEVYIAFETSINDTAGTGVNASAIIAASVDTIANMLCYLGAVGCLNGRMSFHQSMRMICGLLNEATIKAAASFDLTDPERVELSGGADFDVMAMLKPENKP